MSTLLPAAELPTLAELGAIDDERDERVVALARRWLADGRSRWQRAWAAHVPGRIELFGKHTDYAGGRSLTCATEQGFSVLATAREDRRLVVEDAGNGLRAEFDIGPELDTDDPGWTCYPRTVARRLARDFGDQLCGVDVVFDSDLPQAAGMSSSSALVVALFGALAAVNDLAAGRRYREALGAGESLAGYLGAVENGLAFGDFPGDLGVGTFGGSEDHTAILLSAEGCAGQYAYAPVRRERSIAMPDGTTLVVASSGIQAEKTGDARADYNRLALEAAAVAEGWRAANGDDAPHLGAILERGVGLERLCAALDLAGGAAFEAARLRERAEHFYRESGALVPQAGDALERGDTVVLGLLSDRSQSLAARLLGNQLPETMALAEGARALGATAASAFGAGFGGAVWALVAEDDADEFAESWLGHYLDEYAEHGDEALAMITTAAGPARAVGG